MLINKVKITIADKYRVNAVKNVSIKSTWHDTAETCKIELANLAKNMNAKIKEGNTVKVELSQALTDSQDRFKTEFQGYISEVKNSIPFTLICQGEDYVWRRAKATSKFYKEIKISTLLKELFGDAVVVSDSLPDITLTKLRINRATPFEVLQKIKQQYFITAYFKGKKLLTGRPYLTEKNTPTVRYNFEQNIIKDSLTVKTKSNVKLKVRAISILANGQKLEVETGDSGGAERVLYFRGITDQVRLKELAEIQLEKLKKDTIEGGFETFGIPFARHSYLAQLSSSKHPQKTGTYFIDEVQTTFNTSGFRRKVKLGKKIGK